MTANLENTEKIIPDVQEKDSFTEEMFSEFIFPQSELFRVLAPVPDFIGHISRVQYTFLSTERSEIYAIILNFIPSQEMLFLLIPFPPIIFLIVASHNKDGTLHYRLEYLPLRKFLYMIIH